MSLPVLIQKDARQEIGAAFAAFSSSERGDDFLRTVAQKLEQLSEFPLSCRVLFDDTRSAKLSRFPFQLLYIIREVEGEPHVVIVACVHERSNPQTWRTS